MKALNEFIAQENKFAAIFGDKLVDANNITDEDAQKMFSRLDSNLSPEALTSDGEAKKSVVARRYKLYTGAIKDLQALGFVYTVATYA